MHLIFTILIGLVAGLIAKALTPGKSPGGFFITAALGIAGSVLATFAGRALNLYPAGHAAGFFASILGAVVLLLVYHLFTRSSAQAS